MMSPRRATVRLGLPSSSWRGGSGLAYLGDPADRETRRQLNEGPATRLRAHPGGRGRGHERLGRAAAGSGE